MINWVHFNNDKRLRWESDDPKKKIGAKWQLMLERNGHMVPLAPQF